MALQYPLSRDEFLHKLPVSEITFYPLEAVEVNETQGGEVLRADFGQALWQGEVRLDILTSAEAGRVDAMLNLVRQGSASFLIYNMNRPYPTDDPDGAGLVGLTPTLAAVSTDRRDVSIGGLTVGYWLRPGDFIGFSYGNPARRALHQVVIGAAAGAGGIAQVEVNPPLRDGFTLAQAVTLAQPVCKAIIVPGSVQPLRSRRGISRDASFRWMQTLG